MEVIEKLRKYLRDNGLQHKWFAETHLGMSGAHFGNIIRGREKFPKKYWIRIVRATEGEIELEDFEEE